MQDMARDQAARADLSWPALRPYFPRRRISNYLRPLPEYNLIFVKNPKAGCSSIMLWLDRMHTGDMDYDPENIHEEHRLPGVAEIGIPKVLRMLAGAAYRFSFVRNPLRRFESVYQDKIVNRKVQRRPDTPAALGPDVAPDAIVSFEEFLAIVEQQPISEMNPHWRPQHVNLLHPLVSYDHVGRLESFDADLERIREEAGLPHVPLEIRNASMDARTDSVYDGRPDLVRRVEELFARDFELYGY